LPKPLKASLQRINKFGKIQLGLFAKITQYLDNIIQLPCIYLCNRSRCWV